MSLDAVNQRLDQIRMSIAAEAAESDIRDINFGADARRRASIRWLLEQLEAAQVREQHLREACGGLTP